MLGRTVHELAFIKACIVIVQYPIVPYLSVLIACILGAHLSSSPKPWRSGALAVVACMLLELWFALFIWLPYTQRLKQPAKHPVPSSSAARRTLFDRCMSTVPDMENYLRMWFLGAELSDIRRENVREFLLWAFFDLDNNSAELNTQNYNAEVEQFIDRTENILGWRFQPGRGQAKSLRLTFDVIETRYRSVWWYFILALLDILTHAVLVYNGFQYYAQPREKAIFPPRMQQVFSTRRSPAGNLSYWHRPSSPRRSHNQPVVFLHGIGIGLWIYVRFLVEICTKGRDGKGGAAIIALEILPVSFRLTEPPLAKEVFLRQFKTILDHHGCDEFVLVSHSYGSVLTTHAMRCPELQTRIKRAVLIDPVTILLHLPTVAYNFTRRRPKTANEWQLWYFASTDPGVAHCLGRYFFWRESAIWADELSGYMTEPKYADKGQKRLREVTVCLSGQDLIVDSHAVASYLAEVTWADRGAC
ncbi:hypothetical protein CCHL11_07428 [Colletotrichum chlorophyti]|uniref:AB hydrolase-1 domain-containing protein n=1 Tax=Colletotrichum chlorophyti TaxID=708187 RepID=A0A1Q8S667_9PEZI|nr:hypothetical protein CCHL11_07428 [Colletotrichum chlorophyti]